MEWNEGPATLKLPGCNQYRNAAAIQAGMRTDSLSHRDTWE